MAPGAAPALWTPLPEVGGIERAEGESAARVAEWKAEFRDRPNALLHNYGN